MDARGLVSSFLNSVWVAVNVVAYFGGPVVGAALVWMIPVPWIGFGIIWLVGMLLTYGLAYVVIRAYDDDFVFFTMVKERGLETAGFGCGWLVLLVWNEVIYAWETRNSPYRRRVI